MKTTEIRVRPVVRHAVTRYTRDEAGASSESLGEFANEAYAEELAEALRKAHKPKQYAVVQRSFDVDVKVYYAEEIAQAEAYRDQLAAHFGHEYRIYEREVTDPIVIARIENARPGAWSPLNLPAVSG